jgi:hypothetical protein
MKKFNPNLKNIKKTARLPTYYLLRYVLGGVHELDKHRKTC